MPDYQTTITLTAKDQTAQGAESADKRLKALDKDAKIEITAVDKTSSVVDKIKNSIGGMGGAVGGAIGGVVSGLGAIGLAAGGVRAVSDAFTGLVADAMESQKVAAQTNAVLESTHGISGMTAQSVDDLANSLSRVTPFEDETIKSAENMMLTFTNVGQNVFPDATEAALNMATALGEDSSAAAMQLGKALNDPVQGVTALRRVGVQLSDAQQEQVKHFMAVNDIASAQKIILGELSNEFGGSARAAGQTFGGQMKILETQIGNLKEAAFTPLLGVVGQFVGGLADFAGNEDVQNWIADVATAFSGTLSDAMGTAKDLFDGLKAVWEAFTGDSGALGVVYDIIRKVFGDGAAEFVQPFLQMLMDNMPKIQEFVGNAVTAFTNLGGVLGSVLADPIGTLTTLWQSLQDVMMPFQPTAERIGTVINNVVTALQGLWPSPLKDITDHFLSFGQNMTDAATGGDGLQGAMKNVQSGIQGVADAVNNFTGFIENNKVAQAVLVGLLGSLAAAFVLAGIQAAAYAVIQGVTTIATNVMAIATGALNVVMSLNPIALVVIALAGLAAGLIYAYNNIEPFRQAVDTAWTFVTNLWNAIKDNPLEALALLLTGPVGLAFKEAYDNIQPFHDAVDNLWKLVQENIPKIGEVFSALGTTITNIMSNLTITIGPFSWKNGVFTFDTSFLSAIPGFGGGTVTATPAPTPAENQMQSGGWITEPIVGFGLNSGQRYTLGEQAPARPEYVVPAGATPAALGGGSSGLHVTGPVSVTVNGASGPAEAWADAADQLFAELHARVATSMANRPLGAGA